MEKSIVFILSAFVLSGCISTPSIPFSTVSIDEDLSNITVLQKGVTGEDCPAGLVGYGSYSRATSLAIEKVEGATALINAEFSRAERPIAKICVRVTGDAVKI